VAIYARVSTKEQMEKDTIQNQIDACKRYITGFGPDLIDIYPEDISGTTEFTSRPQGARLLSDAAQGRFDTVLCAALDRVGRRALVIHHAIEMFTQAGLLFASVRERLDMATPFGRAVLGIVATMAELEHAMILERTAQGHQSAAEDGMWMGALPLGYRADTPETRRLVRSDEPMPGWEPRTQAQFVQELYHTIVSGTTASALARQWNREGRQTPGMNYGYGFVRPHGPDGAPASGRWSSRGISVIIHNPIYLGSYTVIDADGQEHTKTIEALVTREVWEAAQAQLLHNRRLQNAHAGTRTYLLRGLLRCGTCGAMYCGRQANYNGRTRTWRYACAHQGHGETPCRSKILDGPALERQLLEHVRRFLRHPEQAQAATEAQYAERLAQVAAPATDPARERAEVLAALRKAEGSRANLIAFIADTPPAEQSPTLKQTLRDYDTEVTRLTRAVAALDRPSAPALLPPDAAALQDLLGGLEARLDELVHAKDLEGLRRLIATLFPEITVVSMPTTRQTRRPQKYEASLRLGFRFDPRHCLSYQEGAVPFIEGRHIAWALNDSTLSKFSLPLPLKLLDLPV
jgi:site-specific DNA recombinase